MPDLFAHQQFGKHVLEGLPAYVNVDEDIFMWAQEGPDFWSYWKPWKRSNRSKIMHHEKPIEFVEYLISRNQGNKQVFSYAIGFLCHIVYDEYVHPYINEYVSKINGSWKYCNHTALERAIDVYRMTECGKRPRCLLRNWPKKGIKSIEANINQAYDSIYGWSRSSSAIRSAYRSRFILQLLFLDPLVILYGLGKLTGIERLTSLSYFGKRIPDKTGNNAYWMELNRLLDQATENAAIKVIEMVDRFCCKEICCIRQS